MVEGSAQAMMLFPIPDPTLWTDPGPIEHSRFYRWLWLQFAPLFPTQQAWVDQWKIYLARIEREAEAYAMWLDQMKERELIEQQYQERGEEIAVMLPYELHLMGLSYRRPVQDRKDERPYEKVDYCHVVEWYYDDYAFYFWIATWYPLRPNGVTINNFFRGADDRGSEDKINKKENPVAQTLTGAFGAQVSIEWNPPDHKQRPGLWIVVEHRAGRGKIPNWISYQTCAKEMPKTASPLAFILGQGSNKSLYLNNLGEVFNLGIGGSVGGGKSNMINVILCTFIGRNKPKDLRLFLVDFKRVELAFYRGIQHLGGDIWYVRRRKTDENGKESLGRIRTVTDDYQPKPDEKMYAPLGKNIVTKGQGLIDLLDYLMAEIERRTVLMEGKVKKISTWNKRFPHKKLAYWVVVIDELADVMLQQRFKNKVEPRLIRVIQMGRAMGVHVILATQTPKNTVITGLIQNNITSWIALRCGNGHASALMLDGKWDASYLPAIPGRCIVRQGDMKREIQTPEISDLTIRHIVGMAKAGQTEDELQTKQWSIPPDKVFEYALKELDGYCNERDLHAKFRNDNISRDEIRNILREYEVSGAFKEALEPEIEINDDEYYLAPSPGGGTPRRLIRIDKFKEDFDEKWGQVLAARGARHAQKNGKHPDTDDLKSQKPDELQEFAEDEDQSFDEDYELQDEDSPYGVEDFEAEYDQEPY